MDENNNINEQSLPLGIKGIIPFDEPNPDNKIIKVVGVGGGGGNAVNHMYSEGIKDVTFLQCNTDSQALQASVVPTRLQLGHDGLGAGNDPELGRQAAEESTEDVKKMLSDGTRMTFITAGMGGGTGTGAAPVIAKISKEMGILTVGIVTIPFRWEGEEKIDRALDGVDVLAKNVDALLVINNERLVELYPDLTIPDGLARADEVLTIAAKSIAEIITQHATINVDFRDVSMVLRDGGVAIMSTGYGTGEGRVRKAIEDALNTPLLSNNNIYDARKILLKITYPGNENALRMEEINDVREFMNKMNTRFEVKWGLGPDSELEDNVKVVILATGFNLTEVDGMSIKKLTQDEIENQAKEAEEKERKTNRREQIYGSTGQSSRRRPHIFLFRTEDLDNDDLIFSLDATPTYHRTREMLENLTKQAKGFSTSAQKENQPETGKAVISFT